MAAGGGGFRWPRVSDDFVSSRRRFLLSAETDFFGRGCRTISSAAGDSLFCRRRAAAGGSGWRLVLADDGRLG